MLAVTAWPCLRELVLYDNPLTLTNRTSNLLIVNKFLQEKLGIQVQWYVKWSPSCDVRANNKLEFIPSFQWHLASLVAQRGFAV